MKTLTEYILETKTKKVLYVHGFLGNSHGNSCTKIKNALPEGYEIEGVDYDETSCDKAFYDIQKYIKEHNIDIVVGISLGAFLIMMLPEMKRIAINPCYSPSAELPALNATDEQIESYTKFENDKFKKSNTKESINNLIGCFGTKDHLLGTKYVDKFKHDWGNGSNCIMINSDHSLSNEGASKIAELIAKF